MGQHIQLRKWKRNTMVYRNNGRERLERHEVEVRVLDRRGKQGFRVDYIPTSHGWHYLAIPIHYTPTEITCFQKLQFLLYWKQLHVKTTFVRKIKEMALLFSSVSSLYNSTSSHHRRKLLQNTQITELRETHGSRENLRMQMKRLARWDSKTQVGKIVKNEMKYIFISKNNTK